MTEGMEQLDQRNVIHRFFFPLRNQKQKLPTAKINRSNRWRRSKEHNKSSPSWRFTHTRIANDSSDDEKGISSHKSVEGSEISTKSEKDVPSTAKDDLIFVNTFWTTYDDLLILSIFTQVGIVFRLAVSTYFTFFDAVFSNDTALFVNLPLNCFSCFIMGLLCSGERLMEVIATRFSPLDLQTQIQPGGKRKTDLKSENSSLNDSDEFETELDTIDYDQKSMAIGTSIAVADIPSSSGVARLKARTLFRRGRDQQLQATTAEECFGTDRSYRRRKSRRRLQRQRQQQPPLQPSKGWEPSLKLYDELRDVQLLALERRIRMSKCLVLFPAEQKEVDVMEHYFQSGYRKSCVDEGYEQDECGDSVQSQEKLHFHVSDKRYIDISSHELTRGVESFGDDLELVESYDLDLEEKKQTDNLRASSFCSSSDSEDESPTTINTSIAATSSFGDDKSLSPTYTDDKCNEDIKENASSPVSTSLVAVPTGTEDNHNEVVSDGEITVDTAEETVNHAPPTTPSAGVDQMISDVTTNVTENISRLRRVNLLEGWDAGTTPTAMSDDLLLGLRAGFCGALSSFSSWNSAMGGLILRGHFGEAIIGYVIGLQLAVVSYRFGQHVAVYIFVWRARRQTRKAERRGYGLRLSQNEDVDPIDVEVGEGSSINTKEREIPSVRAFVTVIFVIALITQCISLFFYKDPLEQQLAMSLLFSPLGVLARWKLTKLNQWRPSFALGTFSANILACALGGSLGTLLSGNAGPEERIILVSVISGFAGTLSSVGAFIEEILAGLDPILLRLDGLVYAIISILSAMAVVLVCSTSVDWADEIRHSSQTATMNETIAIMNDTNLHR
jgi:fluoride ion exporter CrcB/FEX